MSDTIQSSKWAQGYVCDHVAHRCNKLRQDRCSKIHVTSNVIDSICMWKVKHGKCYDPDNCIFKYHHPQEMVNHLKRTLIIENQQKMKIQRLNSLKNINAAQQEQIHYLQNEMNKLKQKHKQIELKETKVQDQNQINQIRMNKEFETILSQDTSIVQTSAPSTSQQKVRDITEPHKSTQVSMAHQPDNDVLATETFDKMDYIVQIPLVDHPHKRQTRFLLAMDYILPPRDGLGIMDTALEHMLHYFDMYKVDLIFCEMWQSVCLFIEFSDKTKSNDAYNKLFQFFKTVFYAEDLNELEELWICSQCKHYNQFSERLCGLNTINDKRKDEYIYWCNRCKTINDNTYKKIKYSYQRTSKHNGDQIGSISKNVNVPPSFHEDKRHRSITDPEQTDISAQITRDQTDNEEHDTVGCDTLMGVCGDISCIKSDAHLDEKYIDDDNDERSQQVPEPMEFTKARTVRLKNGRDGKKAHKRALFKTLHKKLSGDDDDNDESDNGSNNISQHRDERTEVELKETEVKYHHENEYLSKYLFLSAVDQDNASETEEHTSIHNESIQMVGLKSILTEDIENLVLLCRQFTEFKQRIHLYTFIQLIMCWNIDGMMTYPLEPRKDDNIGSNLSRNNGNQLPNDNNNPNRNRNNNSNDNGQNNEHNNGNGDSHHNVDKEEHKCCNHLSECQDCAYILTQKNEQIKLFKSLVLTLQKQHQYHTSFENILCKAIDNANYKNKLSNKKLKRKANSTVHKPRYEPIYRAKRNYKISKKLTEDIIPKSITQSISNVYSYLDKSIGMQYNDKQFLDDDDKYTILNCDLNDKLSNEPLYLIAERPYSTKNTYCKYIIHDKLYRAMDLLSYTLPQSSRTKLKQVVMYNKEFRFNQKTVKDIIKKCKWKYIAVFNRKNNQQRLTLSITQEQLNPLIMKSILSIDNRRECLIPILMFDDNSHWIEHILIVHIQREIDIGISLKFTACDVMITGIHLDKDKIFEQHQLFSPHKCEWLAPDGFTSIIHDIHVGNPDDLSNQIKDYKQRYHSFKQLILKFINGKDTERYEILQQHAQMLIKYDNGSLADHLFPVNAVRSPSMISISSTPSPSVSLSNHYSNCSVSPSTDINEFNGSPNSVWQQSEHLSNNM